MTQVTTHTPTLSNSEIIKTVTGIEWREAAYEGEPIIPSLEQIQAFTAEAPDNGWVVFVLERPKATRYDVHSINEDTKRLELSQRIMSQPEAETPEAQIWTMTNILHRGAIAEYLRQDFYEVDPAHFEPMANFMKRTAGEPAPERLQWIHKAWEKADDDNPELEIPHPLSTIIRALQLREQTSKHITREYDRKHPVAMLRSGSLGSIRDVVLDMEGVGQSPVITAESEKIEESQLVLFESDKDSIFPDILLYQQMWDGRSKKTTRGGAVSHGVRIADEAFFPIEKGELEVELKFDLGMLLRAHHPDLTGKQLTSNRGKYLKFIIEGLAQVQYIGWEYTENGKTGIWVPVKMPDNFMPSINSPNDFAVRLSVKLLETQTFNGMAIEKFPLRLTGKRSLPQRNALRASYWIFDHYGTTKKWGLADPKKPKVEERDETDGALLKDGRRLFDSRGKPLKNPYHPEAVPLLGREKNPAAVNRYPILSEKDLLFACYPLGYPQGERKKYIRRSETHFTALENEGFIEIDRDPPDGWRILPSKQHIRAYRGLRRAIKESKKKS